MNYKLNAIIHKYLTAFWDYIHCVSEHLILQSTAANLHV